VISISLLTFSKKLDCQPQLFPTLVRLAAANLSLNAASTLWSNLETNCQCFASTTKIVPVAVSSAPMMTRKSIASRSQKIWP
jgi:hypothetical protein